jgi:drug/metabolite transporter (DMT)-like permease
MLYFLPLFAGLLIALSELASKLVANSENRAETKSIIANILGALCALALIPFEKLQYSSDLSIVLLLLLNGTIMAVGYVLFYTSLKNVDMSLATILSKTSVLVFVLGGMVIFHDSFTTIQIIGAGLILLSLLVLPKLGNLGGIKFTKWMGGIMLVGAMFGISILLDSYLSGFFSPFLYLFLMFATSAVLLALYYGFKDRTVFTRPEFSSIKNQLLASTFTVVGQAVLLTAYRIGAQVSISNLIALVRLPIVILIGLLLLKERDNAKRKLIAATIMIVGLILLKL